MEKNEELKRLEKECEEREGKILNRRAEHEERFSNLLESRKAKKRYIEIEKQEIQLYAEDIILKAFEQHEILIVEAIEIGKDGVRMLVDLGMSKEDKSRNLKWIQEKDVEKKEERFKQTKTYLFWGILRKHFKKINAFIGTHGIKMLEKCVRECKFFNVEKTLNGTIIKVNE